MPACDILPRTRDSDSPVVPRRLAISPFLMSSSNSSEPSGEIAQVKQVGRKPLRHAAQGKVLDRGGKFPQAPRQHGQHVQGQGGVFPDGLEQVFPRDEEDSTRFDGLGICRVIAPLEYGNLGEGLAGAHDVEDLLLAVGRELENLDAACHDDVEPRRPVAVAEDHLACLHRMVDGDLREGLQLLVGKPLEQRKMG